MDGRVEGMGGACARVLGKSAGSPVAVADQAPLPMAVTARTCTS